MRDKETWKDIKGFENKYQVSNFGRVRSKTQKNKYKWYLKKLTLENLNKKSGHLYTILCKNDGKKILKRIHRLVAETFIPSIENKTIINHINGIKTDNRVENLEWCTPQENIHHAIKNNLRKNALTQEKKQQLIFDFKNNMNISELLKKYNITKKQLETIFFKNNIPTKKQCLKRNDGKIYINNKIAAKELKVTQQAISYAVLKNRKCKGYTFEYIKIF